MTHTENVWDKAFSFFVLRLWNKISLYFQRKWIFQVSLNKLSNSETNTESHSGQRAINIDVDSIGYLLHYPTYSANSTPPPTLLMSITNFWPTEKACSYIRKSVLREECTHRVVVVGGLLLGIREQESLCSFSTFICPCIANISLKYNQQYATFRSIYLFL
jgi:hypothetical protein